MSKGVFVAVVMFAMVTGGAMCGEPSSTTPTAVPQRAPASAAEVTPTALSADNAGASLSTFAEATSSFDEFPLLWLGEFYDSDGDGVGDMRISSAYATHGQAFIHPRIGKELAPAITSFDFSYGTCEIKPRRQSCPVPISIDFYPPDTPAVPDEVRSSGPSVDVRGVTARIYNGGALWVETADVSFSIDVFASSEKERLSQATRIAGMLYGANAKAAGITKDSSFRAKGTTDTPSPSTATGTP